MSLSWWWTRSVGADRERKDELAAVPEHSFQSVALVVGSTGIVGASLVDIIPRADTPGGPWKVYALSRRPPPPWSLPSSSSLTHINVDLTDSATVAEALTPLTDITHVFYVAWSPRATEAENREANSAMLRNVLSVVVPNCPALAHVSLQTGIKHYLGPFELIGKIPTPDPPYTEDVPRLDCPNFYYDQEDVLFAAVSRRGGAVSWSVHRPNLILGFSPRSFFNVVCSLCVYASICRKEGVALRWPGCLGSWESFSNASDADLIAEQHIWAAVDPMAKNQAFNCNNGDLYNWKMLWPVLAARFGLEWTGYDGEEKQFKVSEAMAGKEAVWAEIVRENGLVETRLYDVADWWFIDFVVYEHSADSKLLDSMNKSKEHGFLGFRDTVKSFGKWIDKMKAYKIVP
jgi:Delta4-3-oxosteroid 5beta-reductase